MLSNHFFILEHDFKPTVLQNFSRDTSPGLVSFSTAAAFQTLQQLLSQGKLQKKGQEQKPPPLNADRWFI